VSCASSNGSRACQRKRSISALRRETVLATLGATHAAQHVGLAALLVQVEQARIVKRRPRPLVLGQRLHSDGGVGVKVLVELAERAPSGRDQVDRRVRRLPTLHARGAAASSRWRLRIDGRCRASRGSRASTGASPCRITVGRAEVGRCSPPTARRRRRRLLEHVQGDAVDASANNVEQREH
jgi:hypothetical protein